MTSTASKNRAINFAKIFFKNPLDSLAEKMI